MECWWHRKNCTECQWCGVWTLHWSAWKDDDWIWPADHDDMVLSMLLLRLVQLKKGGHTSLKRTRQQAGKGCSKLRKENGRAREVWRREVWRRAGCFGSQWVESGNPGCPCAGLVLIQTQARGPMTREIDRRTKRLQWEISSKAAPSLNGIWCLRWQRGHMAGEQLKMDTLSMGRRPSEKGGIVHWYWGGGGCQAEHSREKLSGFSNSENPEKWQKNQEIVHTLVCLGTPIQCSSMLLLIWKMCSTKSSSACVCLWKHKLKPQQRKRANTNAENGRLEQTRCRKKTLFMVGPSKVLKKKPLLLWLHQEQWSKLNPSCQHWRGHQNALAHELSKRWLLVVTGCWRGPMFLRWSLNMLKN